MTDEAPRKVKRGPRCYHGWSPSACRFCFPAGLPAARPRHRLRCAGCGRFRRRDDPDPDDLDRCSPCRRLGVVALRLFDVATVGATIPP